MKMTTIAFCVMSALATTLVLAEEATVPAATNEGIAAGSNAPTTRPVSNAEAASYGIGYRIGQDMRQTGLPVDSGLLAQGLADAIAGAPSRFSNEQLQAAMQELQREMASRMAVAGADSDKSGLAYRKENKQKEGVVETKSGLQIQTTTEGSGANPTASDMVRVHYTGKLIDGTKFDSSHDRGQPAEFPLRGVIPGWTEGLQLMKVGGKATLVIPPNLGYGVQGSPPTIPPNATLVFDIELLDIIKK